MTEPGREEKSLMTWSEDQRGHTQPDTMKGHELFFKSDMTSCHVLAILCSRLPCETAQWLRTPVLVRSIPLLASASLGRVPALCLNVFLA